MSRFALVSTRYTSSVPAPGTLNIVYPWQTMGGRRVTVACFALAFLPSHRAALPVYGSDDDSSLLSGWSFRTSFDQPAITAER